LELAVQPDLTAGVDGQVFRDTSAALIAYAAGQAPSGRVLVCAARHEGGLQVSVLDSGNGRDPSVQRVRLRDTEGQIALRGGTLEAETYPGEGTKLVVRWPEARNGSDSSALPATEQLGAPAPEGTRTSVLIE
jgi:hypothetical protein